MTNVSTYNIQRPTLLDGTVSSTGIRVPKNVFHADISSSSFTGKELDAETGYSYFGARYYDPATLAAWLSVDPMSDKYPSISPYAYCAWNPVKLVDPEGEEIFYSEGADKYVYKKGKDGNYGFYDIKTGKSYSGKNKEYVNNLVGALGTLKEEKYGNKLVDYFEGSDEHHTIISNNPDKNHSPSGIKIGWSDKSFQIIPIASSLDDDRQYELNTPFVSLGHEMAHVRDRYEGRHKAGTEGTAMLFENLIRYEHGLYQRTYYSMTDLGSVDFNSEKAPVFRSNFYSITGINRDPLKPKY